jgi:hypothetical protein
MVCFGCVTKLRVETHSMEFHVFAPSANAFHATGFSQWLMTNFPERRIHSAKNWRARFLPCRNFLVGQKPEHSKTVISPFANRQSPFAAVFSPI